jgi:hypothetical protein
MLVEGGFVVEIVVGGEKDQSALEWIMRGLVGLGRRGWQLQEHQSRRG